MQRRLPVWLACLVLAGAAIAAHADSGGPLVTLHAPNGGESLPAGDVRTVSWSAEDTDGIAGVDLFYRDAGGAAWTMIARDLADTGSYDWFVPDTPTEAARVRVLVRDALGNPGEDVSDGDFTITARTGSTVATPLRDFHLPGSQPFDVPEFLPNENCDNCHTFESTAPGDSYLGTMMAHAGKDPIFHAALAVAEQDAASSGDFCLRCHTPMGWLAGRSNPTSGLALTDQDLESVSCHFCHLMVDPDHDASDPPVDEEVLALLDEVPPVPGLGMYVVDPQDRRRGPYDDSHTPHGRIPSAFHRGSELCGTCHDVSNPVFERISGAEYALGTLDAPAPDVTAGHLLPIERTYSEWRASAFPDGVYAPEFAGNRPDGTVSTCVDCHMVDVQAKGCFFPSSPVREDLALHEFAGGNTWMPPIMARLYPDDIAAERADSSAARAVRMLRRAAVLGTSVESEADSFRVSITVTNRTGHKLPTGYPEGRRMWLHVEAFDDAMQTVYESGSYDAATGVLSHDEDVVVYEAEPGISHRTAALTGLAPGPSFHFVLNDTLYGDNRIPPMGFENAAFDAFGGRPVEAGVAERYADGQSWDTSSYALPATAHTVVTTLYYQTTSKEYVEFLRDENTTNSAGQDLYDLWVANGRAAPVVMVTDTTYTDPDTPIDEEPGAGDPPTVAFPAVRVLHNPFGAHEPLSLRLDLAVAAEVTLAIFDVQGREMARVPYGSLGGGAHRLRWDGVTAGNVASPGVYFARVGVGDRTFVRRVVRVR